MSIDFSALKRMSASEIAIETRRLARCEQEATAALVGCLAEVDARQLFLSEGYSSMFAYCTQALHLSEGGSYNRIEVARIARNYPVILDRLATGEVTLSVVRLIAPELDERNHLEWLDKVRYLSKRKVEEMLVALKPKPDVPTSVRKLPSAKRERSVTTRNADAGDRAAITGSDGALLTDCESRAIAEAPQAPLRERLEARSLVSPLSPERFKIQFTMASETRAKLQHAQDLLRHAVPDGNIAEVFDRALTVLIEKLERQKFAATNRPCRASNQLSEDEKRSRRLPAAIRRAVWKRDDGRCTYVGLDGRRCASTVFLEFHHVEPFAMGGDSSVDNVRLLCAMHNRLEGALTYGRRKTARQDLRVERSTNSSRGTS